MQLPTGNAADTRVSVCAAVIPFTVITAVPAEFRVTVAVTPFSIYVTIAPGVPVIEAFTIEIPPGKQTPLHKHSIPMYAYITSGELEVDYGSKGKRSFTAGSSYVEAIDWCHFGKSVGDQAVKLIVIYLGQQDPKQLKPEPCAKPD